MLYFRLNFSEEEYITASSPVHFISLEDIGHIMFSFFVTVMVLIQVIATSGGLSVSDDRNQQVRMIYQVLMN